MIENRSRILEAAARVYAAHGFRGATTRRIAHEAGVNEVTLFRTFGSKAALLDEALRWRAASGVVAPHALPDVPVDPERELSAWAAAHLAELRAERALIRKAMGEMEAHPEIGPCVAQGWSSAGDELRRYMAALGEYDFVDWEAFGASDVCASAAARRRPRGATGGVARARRAAASRAAAGLAGTGAAGSAAAGVGAAGAAGAAPGRNEHAFAAGTMLMAALFSDAMGRDVMPELYPQPAEEAPALYVRLFLHVVGCRRPTARPERPSTPSRAKRPRSPRAITKPRP
jgi:AcrR family transcriptional regulator